MLTAWSWLKHRSQTTATTARVTARAMSSGAGDAQNVADEQALVFGEAAAPGEQHRPRATPAEENTPMTVSVEDKREWRMRFISRAKTMAKTTMTALYRVMPSSTPMPTPVRAEWPRASEKKAMPVIDHHGAQKGEQGHDEQHREQGAAHKIVLPPAEKRVHIVPRFVDRRRPAGRRFLFVPGEGVSEGGGGEDLGGGAGGFHRGIQQQHRSALRRT